MPSDATPRLPGGSRGSDETVGPTHDADHRLPPAVRDALQAAEEAFRSAVVAALEEARQALSSLRSSGNGRVERTSRELGALASGPLDPERFTALLVTDAAWDPARLARFEEAHRILAEAADRPEGPDEVQVDEGGSVRDAVAASLQRAGRAFGAARAMTLLRTGVFAPVEHRRLLDGFPFAQWRSFERDLARPLLVRTGGAGLAGVSGLSEFLDGQQKLVLLVDPPCPPAPLARLIAPGVLVCQASDPDELVAALRRPGPAVVAVVPESAAHFLWAPAEGRGLPGTLDLRRLPEAPPTEWIGGMSPAQQAADVHLLEAWGRVSSPSPGTEREAGAGTESPPSPPSPGTGEAGASPPSAQAAAEPDPAGRLAAWLLAQAEIERPG